jgi:hypothetical protein
LSGIINSLEERLNYLENVWFRKLINEN